MEEEATFCVACGRTQPPFIGPLCVACYSAKIPLATLPPFLDVVLCPTCGARQVGNHWEKVRGGPTEEVRRSDLDPHVSVAGPAKLRNAVWEVSGQNPRLREVEAVLTLEVGGETLEVRARTEAHLVLHSCPDCSRRGGHYFTARIQLRAAEEGSPRDLREFKAWAREVWERHLKACSEKQREAVSWEEELKEGWDIFFTDTAAAQAVARSLKERTGAFSRETASLWGMKQGREVHRVTFLVRLPPVGVGDHLEEEGRCWEVFSVGAKGEVELKDVQDGSRRRVQGPATARMRLICGPAGRVSEPVHFPPRGLPFARDPSSGDALPLRGRLPTPGAASEAVHEGTGAPPFPLVLGRKEAWWAPHGGRGDRRQSKG